MSENKKGFDYIGYLAMFYMAAMAYSAVMGQKFISTPFGIMSAASLISPLWFITGDIIAEVYGFTQAMRLFWSVVIIQFVFACLSTAIIHFNSPSELIISSYHLIFSPMLRMSLFELIGISIAWRLNAVLLTKWKILIQGRYFWLRSIGASGLGEVLYSLVAVSLTLLGTIPLKDTVQIVAWSCFLKVAITIALSLPANLICQWIKKHEKVDAYETASFNPLKKYYSQV